MNASRLDQAAEWTGHWWLPEDPDHPVPGILRYEPTNGLTLSLIGGFENRILQRESENRVAVLEGSRSWDLIQGIADNKRVTLLSCDPISSKSYGLWSAGPHKQVVTAQTALIGVHLDSSEDEIFTECQISVEGLTQWSADSVFSMKLLRENNRLTGEASLLAKRIDEPEARVDGTSVTLARSHTAPSFDQKRGLTQGRMQETAFFRLRPEEPWSTATAREHTFALRDLISLATHTAAAILWMSLRMSAKERQYPGGYPVRDREVEVYWQQMMPGNADAPAEKPRDLLFTCEHHSFTEVVPRWYEIR